MAECFITNLLHSFLFSFVRLLVGFGGDCDQTTAVGASCSGQDCFFYDSNDQIMPSDTTLKPFCSCKYGYFGDYCQYFMTTICLFDESGNTLQPLHEFCVRSGGFCPLPNTNMFCANKGKCSNAGSATLLTKHM